MQLREALNNIAEIRAQIERTESFRGLRSLAVTASSMSVFIGAMVSHLLGVERGRAAFATVWIGVASASLLGVVFEMWHRCQKSDSDIGRKLIWQAHRSIAVQLAPSLMVGAVMTFVLLWKSETSWMLPGVWAMLYGLGLLNCRQHLPQFGKWVAGFYLVCGALALVCCLEMEALDVRLANGQMVGIFGIGQLVLASLVYWKLERQSGEEDQ